MQLKSDKSDGRSHASPLSLMLIERHPAVVRRMLNELRSSATDSADSDENIAVANAG
jgi:hypothetical protein